MPDRYKCLCCGRDKFYRMYQPHRCCCGTTTKNWKKIAKARGIIGHSFIKVENK
jgi:hypothetical protein